MPDPGQNVEQTSQTQTPAPQVEQTIPPELAQQMALSLNGPTPPAATQEAVVDNSKNVPDSSTQVVTEPPAQTDPFLIFKDKFGYQSPEDAIKEIEELRVLKANPVPVEYEFENEQSKNLFKSFQKGDRKAIYEALAQEQRLEALTAVEVNKDNAADIIKLGMAIKYKDLTPQEIDYKFSKQFSIPKPPVQGVTEEDEDFNLRKTDWQEQVNDVEMSKIIEAKLARPELDAAKSKIIFPEVEQANQPSVDEGYTQYKKSLEDGPKLLAEMKEIYKPFTPKTIETKIKFIDEPNKIDFEFQYEPAVESFTKSVDMALDVNKFFDTFKLPDGQFDNAKFLKAIHFATNGEQMLKEAINQSKNATIKSFLPDNGGNGLQRQFPQHQELSELDKQMKASLAGYSRS